MGDEDGRKVFVGNLSYDTRDEDLRSHFESVAGSGEVESATIITDRENGKSKGFGFVTFYDGRHVQDVIDQLHQKDLDGRPITVAKSNPRGGGGRSYGGGGGYGGRDDYGGNYGRNSGRDW